MSVKKKRMAVSIKGGKLSSDHAIKVKFTPQMKATNTAKAMWTEVIGLS
jgi:hypothetical protein